MRNDVQLRIGSMLYGGWKEIRISSGIGQITGEFSLKVSESWTESAIRRPISKGQACTVLVNSKPIITGYVDDVEVDYDDQSHEVEITGRDRTGDLVDCSAPSVEWKGRTLLQVAKELCEPYKISVRADVDVSEPFTKLKTHEGESVFEVLETGAKHRGVLLVSDGLGGLVITRASMLMVPTALVFGANIKRARGRSSLKDRFSDYTVKGQQRGGDTFSVDTSNDVKGVATDDFVKRHRPKTIVAESQVDLKTAKERAEWESKVRRGRSELVTYTTPGWEHSGGLWSPNTLVVVKDAFMGIQGRRLISAVTLLLDEKEGTRAEITVTRSSAYSALAIPEKDDDSDF